MQDEPEFTVEKSAGTIVLRLSGQWALPRTADKRDHLEASAAKLAEAGKYAPEAIFNLENVERLDTAGAWLIGRICHDLKEQGIVSSFAPLDPKFKILLDEASYRELKAPEADQGSYLVNFLADIGEGVVSAGRDIYENAVFLGRVIVTLSGIIVAPRRFRFTSLVFHIEAIAFRSVPIIALINLLVGGIVAQQGILQLRRFGATTFVVDLIGILILRELGLLLTAIMIAGRSGSAITAELGSMKMREEIDALTVMGMRPVEVLIIPRIFALMISLPILTFIADISALFGGLVTAWGYAGINPASFLLLLKDAITLHTFFIGMIKAPFMAFVIGLIATVEGLAVEGSAESLGRRVTASVVKSIFMVIVLDGVFAIFFAGIRF